VSYSTNSEVIDWVMQDVLENLHGGEILPAFLRKSRSSAAALINAAVCAQMQVPVCTMFEQSVGDRLREAELNLVEMYEWRRIDQSNVPEQVIRQYEDTLKWLDEVRKGTAPLPVQQSHGPVGSVVMTRGGGRLSEIRRVVEFNLELPADAEGPLYLEYADTGQPLWIPDIELAIDAMAYVLTGDPSAVLSLSLEIDDAAVDDDGLSADVSWPTGSRRYSEANGSVSVKPTGKLAMKVAWDPGNSGVPTAAHLKVWLFVSGDAEEV